MMAVSSWETTQIGRLALPANGSRRTLSGPQNNRNHRLIATHVATWNGSSAQWVAATPTRLQGHIDF